MQAIDLTDMHQLLTLPIESMVAYFEKMVQYSTQLGLTAYQKEVVMWFNKTWSLF